MIQEKDFLYRVPVKTAPITTPGGQIRNPEILVDVEGGEFMHGNILDANSTNKLINQSVKDAVDDKFIENGYVTKDLLEAETSARTKGDEDLSAKIQAEQTRAEGKEKEISDKLAIVDGDSNTEGSFRKAIADVIAAAPEDLDTLKEIADKLAGKQDKGNYMEYSSKNDDGYTIDCELNTSEPITIDDKAGHRAFVTVSGIQANDDNAGNSSQLTASSLVISNGIKTRTIYTVDGITSNKYDDCLATSDGTFKPISDFVLSSAYNEDITALEARIAALEAKHPEAAA